MPIATGTAIAIAAGAGAAGSIAGGVLANQGAQSQASAAERSSAAAIAEQRRQFDITRQTLQPWVSAGSNAVNRLQFLLGLGPTSNTWSGGGGVGPTVSPTSVGGRTLNLMPNRFGRFALPGDTGFDVPELPTTPPGGGAPAAPAPIPGDYGSLMRDFSIADFETDPGYAFRLAEGQKALERSAAARGALFGGGTLRGLTRYNQDFASNEFTNAYNRFQQNRATRYNQLASLAGLGQVSAGQLANAGMSNAQYIGNTMIGGATSAAAARASGYGALGAGIAGAAQAPMNWFLLQQLSRPSSGGGTWV